MPHIFISHSKHDTDAIHFFLEAFAGTNVKPHLVELEFGPPTGMNAEKIAADIQSANAIFVLLSRNVEKLSYTRDWITWECGAALNKEVWVFERLGHGAISVAVPRVNHYVVFEQDEEWRKYLGAIIQSYDDSHVIPTLSATTGGGALLNAKEPGKGAAIGLALGLGLLWMRSVAKQSFGIEVRCEKCGSNFRIHRVGMFRCVVCNATLLMSTLPAAGATSPVSS